MAAFLTFFMGFLHLQSTNASPSLLAYFALLDPDQNNRRFNTNVGNVPVTAATHKGRAKSCSGAQLLRADGTFDFHANREDAMTAAQYSFLVASFFALGAVLQIVRAVAGLPITVGQTSIPIWVSWVACGVAIVLAWLGYTSSQS
jgi:hypothetical protein